jgi:hypothetical protein
VFPNPKYPYSRGSEFFVYLNIAILISSDLPIPVVASCFRKAAAYRTSVPKAPVDENCCLDGGEKEIWLTMYVFGM